MAKIKGASIPDTAKQAARLMLVSARVAGAANLDPKIRSLAWREAARYRQVWIRQKSKPDRRPSTGIFA